MVIHPVRITEVEKRPYVWLHDRRFRETYLIHEPLAAALGIGLDVEEPIRNMVIDSGGGTTEIRSNCIIRYCTTIHSRCRGRIYRRHHRLYAQRSAICSSVERTAEKIRNKHQGSNKNLDIIPDPIRSMARI